MAGTSEGDIPMVGTNMRKLSLAMVLAAMIIGTAAPAATIFLPMVMISGNVPRGLIRTHNRIVEIYGLSDVVLIRDIRAHGLLSSRASAAADSDAAMRPDGGDSDGFFGSSRATWAGLIGGLALIGGTLRRQGRPRSVIA